MRNPSYIKVLSINNTRNQKGFEEHFETRKGNTLCFSFHIKEECRSIKHQGFGKVYF
jgi:hypothetical protein